MKQSLQTIIKVALLALIGLTFFFYFIPMSTEIPQEILNPPQPKDNKGDENVEQTEVKLQSSNNIAELFGYVKPTLTPTPRVTPKPTPTPVPTPETPTWLKLVGKYVDNGKQYYSFKDERGPMIIHLAKGVTDKGWSFIEETSEGYYLKKDRKKYLVRK